jgi:hypothetical protein
MERGRGELYGREQDIKSDHNIYLHTVAVQAQSLSLRASLPNQPAVDHAFKPIT